MKTFAHAIRPLANDLFSSLLFAGLLAAGVDAQTATLIAMGVGLAHVWLWLMLRKPIAPLQWASLGLVLVFGTASLFLHDPRFLMAKPTVIYLILAVVMLKRGWMLRYLPPIAVGRGEGLMVAYGYAWAGLMALTAAANLAIAILAPVYWPLFKAVWPLGSKLVLFAAQYAHIRARTIRQMRAGLATAA
ncbi:MAG: septation protein IspZ [Phenylobacterium sp.]|jgi:intracellular septation protein A